MIFKKLKEINLPDFVKVNVVGLRDEKDKFIPMPDSEQLVLQGSKIMLIGSGDSIRAAKKIARKKEKPREMQYV